MLIHRLKTYRIIILILGGCWALSSCNVYKHLPDDEQLYAGAEIELKADSTNSKETKKIMLGQLEAIPRPEPNSRIFGYPLQVGIYYWLETPKTKGIKYSLRKRFGQKPVFYTPNILSRNETSINSFLTMEGFFRSSVTGRLEPTKHPNEVKAIYTVNLPQRYMLDSVKYVTDTLQKLPENLVTRFANEAKSSILHPNHPYRFENIKTENNRIDRNLRNQGFFFFQPNYLEILADSTVGDHAVDIFYTLKETIPVRSQKQYLINDIYVFSSDDIGQVKADSVDYDADFFRGIILADSSKRFNQRVFTDAIGFRPGNFYSVDQNDVSMQRLINLNTFDLVKNRFEVVNRLDSSLLNVYYYLTPKKSKSIRAEVNALTRSSGYSGTQFALNWMNRNTFHGAEALNISANVSYELQIGANKVPTANQDYKNSFRLGLEGTLTFPRFFIPFLKYNPEVSRILPKTTATLSYQTIIQRGLYHLNSANAGLNYVWRKGAIHEYTLTPLSVSYVHSSNLSEDLVDLIIEDPLRWIFILDDQLIPEGSFSYTYTPAIPASKKYSFIFTGNLDGAGNFVSLLQKLDTNNPEPGSLFGVAYSQYVRLDGDFRYYRNLGKNLRWANRFFGGVGVPYGNSSSLPYTRQYFSGGSNSLRAFRARSVGPGSYERKDSSFEQAYGNFTGDIKLELNTELRQKLSQYFGLAYFIDAGNVWMYKQNNFYEPTDDVIFSNHFYKQIAVGAGLGLRLDFTFFVLRFDLATPLRIPYGPENERWVINKIDLGNRDWRRQNLLLNIAVGYPF